MKKFFTLVVVSSLLNVSMRAQQALLLTCADGVTQAVELATVDSLSFSADGSELLVAANGSCQKLASTDIVSMTYGDYQGNRI